MDFEELYHNHADAVYGYLMFKLGNQQLTEDILQETFLAVYQNMQKLYQVASPKAWLFSIAHNKMVDHLRSKRPGSQSNPEFLPATNENDSNLFVKEALSQLP